MLKQNFESLISCNIDENVISIKINGKEDAIAFPFGFTVEDIVDCLCNFLSSEDILFPQYFCANVYEHEMIHLFKRNFDLMINFFVDDNIFVISNAKYEKVWNLKYNDETFIIDLQNIITKILMHDCTFTEMSSHIIFEGEN